MLEALESFWQIMQKNLSLGELQLPFNWLDLILKAVLPLVGVIFLFRLIRWIQNRALEKAKSGEKATRIFKNVTRIAMAFLTVGVIIASIAALFGGKFFEYLGQFFGLLNKPFFVSGNTSISFVTIILLIPVFYAASWSGKAARQMMEKTLFEKLGLDEARKFSISSLTRYIVMGIVLLIGLAIIGIDLSAIGVLVGVLGIGLGFGLQNIVSNLFAGLVIISSRPIKEGDRIFVQGIEGTIRRIRLISTNVVTLENENIIVPNAELISKPIHNFSHDDRNVIVVNRVSVAYHSDIDQVTDTLREAGLLCLEALPETEPVVRILNFGDYGIEMELRTTIRDVTNRPHAKSAINYNIWRLFKDRNISIPFPQLDLHYPEGRIEKKH